MALTAHKSNRRTKNINDRRIRHFNVEAGVTIFSGMLIAVDSADDLGKPAPAAQTLRFVGVARDGFDNSASASDTTDTPLLVEIGQLERLTLSTTPVPADIGKAVFYVDDEEVTLTPPSAVTTCVGTISELAGDDDVFVDTAQLGKQFDLDVS